VSNKVGYKKYFKNSQDILEIWNQGCKQIKLKGRTA